MITLQERVHSSPPPTGWKLNKLHRVLRVRKGFKNTGMQEDNLLSLSYGRIIQKNIDAAEGLLPESFETYQIVEPGNIVMWLTDFQNDKRSLRQGLVKERGIITSAYDALELQKGHDPRFWAYALLALDLAKYYYSLGGGVRQSIKFLDFPNDWISTPDSAIQKAIADFLDRETARIEELIETKQRLIALFGEKRLAVISESTVKGLNPSAKMKNTGIEWLGEIPAHWKVMPIKYLAIRSLIDGPHVTPTKFDEGVPFISAESINRGRINFEKKWGCISESDHKLYSKRYKPQRDDIFVVKLGATTGRVARVETDDDFNIWVPIAAIRPKSEKLSKHIYYALQSNQVNDAYQILWTYGTQQTLGLGTLSNLRLPVPPEAEMEDIDRYLADRLPKMESAIEMTGQSIERLKEYRSALITAAVTGQIDVRTWGKQGQTDRRLDEIEEAMQA